MVSVRFPRSLRFRPHAWACAGLFALAVPAQAAGLEELLRAGLERNTRLRADREEVLGTSHDTLASASAINPSLEIEAAHNFTDPANPFAAVRVSQEIQPGLRRKAREAAKADLSLQQAWLRAGEMDLAAEIRTAYLEVLFLDRKAGLQREVIARWEALAKIAAGQVAQGRLSEVDQTQARLNALKAGQQEMEILSRRGAALVRLQTMAGLSAPPADLEPLPLDSLPGLPDKDTLLTWARAANPELAAWTSGVAAGKRQLALEEGRAATAFHFSAGYERSEDGAHLVGGGIGLPLPFGTRNQAHIFRARSGIRSAELRRASAEERLDADIATAVARLRSLAERLSHHRGQVRDLVRRQLELSEKGFRQGQLGVFDLSRVQEEYLDREVEALGLLEEYHREWIRLGRSVGGKTW